MQLLSINIENFRCFKNFNINFAPGASVFIGRNGSGKTSLIKAILYALNFIFTTDKSLGDDILAAGNPDLKIKSMEINEFYQNNHEDLPSVFANIHAVANYKDEEFDWDIYKRSTKNASANSLKYRNAYHKFMNIFKKYNELPLLAYFSDSFPHRLSNISNFAKAQISNGKNIIRNFGYYQWDNENACTTIWENRLINSMIIDMQLQKDNDYIHNEVDFVTKCVIGISQPISKQCDNSFIINDIFFAFNEKNQPILWLKLKDGNEIRFKELPAGYRRIYSIALDMAYRAYILNAGLKTESKNIEGIVLIDEIDLHLHPSLALDILSRLQKTFPKVQFIITTHSPLVLSNLKNDNGRNVIYKIIQGKIAPQQLPNIYGIDYNTTLLNALDTGKSDERLENIKNAILRAMLLHHERIEKAKKEELRIYLKDNNDYDRVMKEIRKEYEMDK